MDDNGNRLAPGPTPEEVAELRRQQRERLMEHMRNFERKLYDDTPDRFREAWHQAMTGQTRPLDDVLSELDEDKGE